MSKPNILYLHSHDTGRFIRPFGHAVDTPNLQRLAEEGVLFRNNHCICPTCSPSRSALLTGTYPHENGMLGLAHRGFRLHDYGWHVIHPLKEAGYHTVLSGTQHIASQRLADELGVAQPADVIGYDECLGWEPEAHTQAVEWLRSKPTGPFFLSVGFHETHREFPELEDGDGEDPRYTLPPAPLPDTPRTRTDTARFNKMARDLDARMGAVLAALDEEGLAENTIVVCTTDHGIAFPRMKCNLQDSGTGTFLIVRGPGGFGGGAVVDAMTTHMDLYPTLCELVGIEPPERLRGKSLLPLVRGETDRLHDEIYTEVSYHASYEPMRAVRTDRYKYIRRFDPRLRPVLPNCDAGLSKEAWLAAGWGDKRPEEEMLFDLMFDPNETGNLVEDPGLAYVLSDMRTLLAAHMEQTDDPLCAGYILPPEGAEVTWMDAREPSSAERLKRERKG